VYFYFLKNKDKFLFLKKFSIKNIFIKNYLSKNYVSYLKFNQNKILKIIKMGNEIEYGEDDFMAVDEPPPLPENLGKERELGKPWPGMKEQMKRWHDELNIMASSQECCFECKYK
jgi:hypothetical protein